MITFAPSHPAIASWQALHATRPAFKCPHLQQPTLCWYATDLAYSPAVWAHADKQLHMLQVDKASLEERLQHLEPSPAVDDVAGPALTTPPAPMHASPPGSWPPAARYVFS